MAVKIQSEQKLVPNMKNSQNPTLEKYKKIRYFHLVEKRITFSLSVLHSKLVFSFSSKTYNISEYEMKGQSTETSAKGAIFSKNNCQTKKFYSHAKFAFRNI